MKYLLYFLICFLSLNGMAETLDFMLFDVPNPKVISLKEAARLALKQNPSLKKTEQEVKLAESDSLLATSALLPKASFRASHQAADTQKKLEKNSDVGIILQVPVLDITSLIQTRSKQQSLISAKEKYLFAQDSLINSVAVLYIDALIKQSEKDNAIFLKDQYQRELLSLEKKSKVGSARSLDVVRARYLVNKAHSDYLIKNQEFLLAMGELGKKISVPEIFSLSMINVESPHLIKSQEELLPLALSSYDVKVAERNLASAHYTLLSEKLDFLPKLNVSLSSGYQFFQEKISHLGSPEHVTRLMFNLDLPLFSGGARFAHIKNKNAQETLNEITLNEKRTFKKNALYALLQTIKDLKTIKLSADSALDAATKTKSSAERLFNLGEATALELTEAKTNMVAAKNQLANTTLKLEARKIQLLFLIGKIKEII